MKEFTEISLYPKGEKIPLPMLYVAMKWTRYSNREKFGANYSVIRREFEQNMMESDLWNFTEILKKVTVEITNNVCHVQRFVMNDCDLLFECFIL